MELFSNFTNSTVNSTRNASEVTTTPGGARVHYARETEVSHMFRLVLYSLIFLLTLVGNSLVIAIVVKSKELKTVTGYLIANLAAADLSVAVICIPFTLIYFELNHWPFGYAMCKILPTAQGMSVMASIGTLTAISLGGSTEPPEPPLDPPQAERLEKFIPLLKFQHSHRNYRFRSIVYPYDPRISTAKVKYILLAVWLLAAAVGFPMLAVMETQQRGGKIVCIELGWPNESYRKAYSVITFGMTYAVPLPLISVWYVIIVLKLREAARKTDDKEGFRVAQAKGKVVRMLIAVVVCYALCFLLFHVTFLWWEFGNGGEFSYVWVMLSWSQVLMYANSAVNPILYAFLSTQFRRGLKRILRCHNRKIPRHTSSRLLSSTRTSFYDRTTRTWVSQTDV